ncbi:hypothetical protein [Chromobacterium haemolyticum]|uniref:hypothetical protein n=1 Tax=Chromobacterium haemolyticum TaxID=394935 RepID=UPI0015C4D172|nr:hypothetical protein [Chromobacterium haemolyticum]
MSKNRTEELLLVLSSAGKSIDTWPAWKQAMVSSRSQTTNSNTRPQTSLKPSKQDKR